MSEALSGVVIIEDRENWQRFMEEAVEFSGRIVTARLTEFDPAKEYLEDLASQTHEGNPPDPQVFLIDGKLGKELPHRKDGAILAAIIGDNLSPENITIGMSLMSVPNVDLDLGKDNINDLYELLKQTNEELRSLHPRR